MKRNFKIISVLTISLLFFYGCKKNQVEQNNAQVENVVESVNLQTENFTYINDENEINMPSEHELTDKEVEYLNKKIHEEVEKQKKDPTCFFHYTEDFIRIVNEITDRLSKIPQDEFIKMVEATQASEGRDENRHFVWFDNQGRNVHWKRRDNLGEAWYYYESFTYGVIMCEMSDFGTKYFYGTDLYGNQFYHKNDWEDPSWYHYDSNKKIIYKKEVNGNEKWFLYDKKGDLIYVKRSDGSEWYNEVTQNSCNFFGYNTWNHYEKCLSENFNPESITRISIDNMTYYLRKQDNGTALYIKDCDSILPGYNACHMDFEQPTSNERNIHLSEGGAVSESRYNFTKYANSISIDIKMDDQGDIYNVDSKILKDRIEISYTIDRYVYDYWGENLEGKRTFECKETFYNTPRSYLYEQLADKLNIMLYEKNDDNENWKEVNEKIIPHLHKPELRVARNLIFARHGYIFKSQDLKAVFSTFSWYKPEIEDSSSITLTPEEKSLVDQIQLYESRF